MLSNALPPMRFTLDRIEEALKRHKPELLTNAPGIKAAVALIIRHGMDDLEVLFIERASHQNDPWSGDLGFPGGKVEESDIDARHTAERETLEEIGLDLATARYLGRLSDLPGATTPVQVSCFVYEMKGPARFRLNDEVQDLFWVALGELDNPTRHVEAKVRFKGKDLHRPAIRLPQSEKPILWGLTYRLITQFLEILKK